MQAMWNDTDVPLAFFISFRTYATWLHGDSRGSIDRHHNHYGTPKIPSNIAWESISAARSKHPPIFLDKFMRRSTREGIEETCLYRQWSLVAINVRTNHVHLVVLNPGKSPTQLLTAFKANATRKMRQKGHWANSYSPWSAHGSKRYLWNENQIGNALQYVLADQGAELPESFD